VRLDEPGLPDAHHPGSRGVGAGEDAVGFGLTDGRRRTMRTIDELQRVGEAGIVGDAIPHRRTVTLDRAVVRAPNRVGRQPLIADVVELDHEITLQRPIERRYGLGLAVLLLLPVDGLTIPNLLTRVALASFVTHGEGRDAEHHGREGDLALRHATFLLFAGLAVATAADYVPQRVGC